MGQSWKNQTEDQYQGFAVKKKAQMTNMLFKGVSRL